MIQAIEAFADNYIWAITDDQQGCAAVVDPGDPAPVMEFLRAKSLTLAAILVTHHHADHTGGIATLAAHAPRPNSAADLPVFGPAGEPIAGIQHPLREGDRVSLPELNCSFDVIEVPGHTRGHIAYFGRHDRQQILFCGDTLFAGGCGRIFEGTADQMWASLKKLASLPDETAVYCAHEYTLSNLRFACAARPTIPEIAHRYTQVHALREHGKITLPSTIGLERQTNPFLLCENADQFAAMRSHKDQFRG